MAQQTINVGAAPNDGTGTPLRTAFQYTNSNFSELYTAVGPSGNNIVVPGNATITGDLTAARLTVTGSTIPANGVYLPSANTVGVSANSLLQHSIAPLGVFQWFDGAGGTRMALNSNGLIRGGTVADIVSSESATFTNIGNIGATYGASTGTYFVAKVGAANGIVELKADARSGAYPPMVFTTGSTERMRIDSSGNIGVGVTPSAGRGAIQLSAGVGFPATQVASSDANTLDDYEEGTWTPTAGDASSGGNQATTATAVGRYTKVGRLVTVHFELTDINTTGLTAGNAMYVRGLPFAASSAATQFGTIAGAGITFTGFLTCGVFNSTAFPIYATSTGGSLADIKVSGFASGTADIFGTLTYFV